MLAAHLTLEKQGSQEIPRTPSEVAENAENAENSADWL